MGREAGGLSRVIACVDLALLHGQSLVRADQDSGAESDEGETAETTRQALAPPGWAPTLCKHRFVNWTSFFSSLACSCLNELVCGDGAPVIWDAEELCVSEYQCFFPHP